MVKQVLAGILIIQSALIASAVVPTARQMRGPFPIMSTPYFEDGAVDYEGLARELAFVVQSGCPGVIWCQSNDAVDLLTTEEKFKGFETCAKASEGKDITLTLGVNGTNTAQLLELAVEVERIALRHPTTRLAMVSRPPDDVRSEADIEAAWTALAKVTKRPVIFQTYGTSETPATRGSLRRSSWMRGKRPSWISCTGTCLNSRKTRQPYDVIRANCGLHFMRFVGIRKEGSKGH